MNKNNYKGIILAGGTGSRLFPLTLSTSKQLLPIYDKPMIYYSLSVLMLAGIRQILLISSPKDINSYKNLLGNGSQLGIEIEYKIQNKPNGIAESFILGEDFIENRNVALILGDNIFFGNDLSNKLKNATRLESGCSLFGYYVNDPERFGVIEFDKTNKTIPIGVIEKPENPPSNIAVTGLYFYDNDVISVGKDLKPSSRNELEISDINKFYFDNKNKEVNLEVLGRGFTWHDSGTYESLLSAGKFVENIQKNQQFYVACIEEVAFNNKWIDQDDVIKLSKKYKNEYGDYLRRIVKK